MSAPDAADEGRQQVLTFRVGAARLAAPASDVTEVLRRLRVTRVPHAPPGLMGVASVRGAVVPVVSLARVLGGGDAGGGASATSRILLLRAGEPVAVEVDEVGALTRLDTSATGGPMPGGLYQHGDGAVRLIDLMALLRQDFAGLVRRGAAGTANRADPAQRRQTAREGQAFLAFTLAGQAYALPLAEVGEVIAPPEHLATLPRTDAAMVGVVSLRGGLLPIVSLRVLLGLGGDERQAGCRVVVAYIGDARVGFLVDRLASILRVPADSVGPVPAVLNRGRGEAHIQAICRLPDGHGLVSILSGARLFRDETMAHILADGRRKGDGQEGKTLMTTPIQNGQDIGDRVVVFQLGDEEYGLPVDAVEEVVRLPDTLTRVPKAPGFIEGVMNLRGQVLPVIDQRRRFGVDGAATGRRRVIVTRINGKLAGFAVDTVSEILALGPDQVREAPRFVQPGAQPGDDTPVFTRVANLETADGAGRMILLIEPQALLDRAERDLLVALEDALKGISAATGSAPP
ncbi:chemotaxis protein CheW [Azospirillum sp. B4]|uniref:chemotaxis protein CheW n=1 Tax=Azospirillum sp. B4 TaxID=95605 RepID=UPI00034757EF|nr:chemotaxis protein CheW [Azospirillum sp. B4]